MMKRFLSMMIFVLLLPGVASAQELMVAVAANVQYPVEELKAEFQKQAGISIVTAFGSSGKFTAQIANGAPFDVFLSADMDYPQALKDRALTHNSPKVYAYGTLVLWTMCGVDLSKGMEVLADGPVKRIAVASADTAPYGRQAVKALKYFNLYDRVSAKLVYGESIAQTNQFITTKAAEAGFTAKSVVLAPNMKGEGAWIEVDKDSYDPIAQGAVILKHAEKGNLEAAEKFFDFLFSAEARDIFKKYGYALP